MTFLPRLIVVALSAYGAASLCGSAAVILCWRRVAARLDADRLFRWRLAPTAAATVASLLGAAAFARFEPRAGVERTGVLLISLAAMTVAMVCAGIVRLAAGHVATRRALRHWMTSAESSALPGASIPVSVVASAFPIVAVVGIVRPRMIVARSVLDACSADEMRAVVAHEEWHFRHRDNARRALLTVLPDALAWLPFSRRAGRQWYEATEQTADDAAARSIRAGHLHLASALLRVARLAPADQTPLALPITALYRGENIETRVRRILDHAATPPPTHAATRLLISSAVLIGLSLLALRPIHELVETAVNGLP